MNYDEKLRNLVNRRSDQQFVQKSFSADSAYHILNEAFNSIDYPESVKYTIGSMTEVDQAYTNNTIKEGERIKVQLESLRDNGYITSFRFQGSTTNNTHIKAYSDIDLLIIQEKFIFSSSSNTQNYSGDWKSEQINLRKSCYEKLHSVYYSADVDNSGSFSISLSGGSLKRNIDVVPSCWYLSQSFYNEQTEENKGIRVFNKDCSDYNTNFPFINNKLIEQKDRMCNGNFRKAIRLVKTLKGDSARNLKISSYDIMALLYHMPNNNYLVNTQFMILVRNIKDHLLNYCNSPALFMSLSVPDNTRKICDKTTLEDLKGITIEIGDLERDLIQDLSKVYKTINENIVIRNRFFL